MKLLVRNLALSTTEEKLVSLFSEHGKVQSCSLVLDSKTGKSKGFGFVEMPKIGDAKAAMKTLNGFKLAGNFIRVKKAEQKTSEVEVVVAEKEAEPVQFKQAAKKYVAKSPVVKKTFSEKTTAEKTTEKNNNDAEVINNNDNAANLYGKIKESDDY
ncbi:RNA recognition motif domain-containing protein [Psychromonas sp. Urea-02u-13]|uniref:RNA recognition motif domain-containing protein n=1 Tax=Psychromonas sp. Urea-02u-13 TaxID=2058326 RepID=UPI000C346D9D|nr:RNA-binding protein [Psychromonas sp. Urea-02u-13]PKG39349.1 RNA-binding protein [Psychromonas sp. Urea-02u-13]